MKTLNTIFTFTLLSLFGLLPACSAMPAKPQNLAPGNYAPIREYITSLVKQEMKKNDVTGLSLALVDDQRIIWSEGFGWADQAAKVPATPETLYRIGSITKLFTATAAMQLVEQGKFDIDKPLAEYLPDFSIQSRFAEPRKITPRMLMTHHSGLPSDILKGMWTRNPAPFNTLVGQIKDEYVSTQPNTVFAYSNLGFSLLGCAVEQAAGVPYTSYVDAHLLRPLGMAHTSFAPGPAAPPRGAKAYSRNAEALEPDLRDLPAGGLNSSVEDLSRFMAMVFNAGKANDAQIIKPETLSEMLRPQNTDVPLDLNFRVGLAWQLSGLGDINIRNAGTVAHHSGATINHHAMLLVLPDHKLGVVVLSNSATSARVVNKIAVEMLKLALEAKTGVKQPEEKNSQSIAFQDAPLTDAQQQYEGRYQTMMGMVPVANKKDYLRAEAMGTSLRLLPRNDGMLGLQYKFFGLFTVSLGDLDRVGISRETVSGHDILKASLDGQELLIGERIHAAPVPESWKKKLGKYDIINAGDDAMLAKDISLKIEDNYFFIEYSLPLMIKGPLRFALNPLSENEAVIAGLGRGMGETIRVVHRNNEELIRYSGYLLRKHKDSSSDAQ